MTFKFQSLTDIVNMTNLIVISLINEIIVLILIWICKLHCTHFKKKISSNWRKSLSSTKSIDNNNNNNNNNNNR